MINLNLINLNNLFVYKRFHYLISSCMHFNNLNATLCFSCLKVFTMHGPYRKLCVQYYWFLHWDTQKHFVMRIQFWIIIQFYSKVIKYFTFYYESYLEITFWRFPTNLKSIYDLFFLDKPKFNNLHNLFIYKRIHYLTSSCMHF